MRDLQRRSRAVLLVALMACVVVSLAAVGHADTYWKTTAVDNDWRNGDNWTDGVPDTSDIAYFTNSNITSVELNPFVPPRADGRALGIHFSGASDFTISPGVGHVIYAYGGGVTAQDGNQTFTCEVRPSATGVFPVVNNGTGLLDFNSSLMAQPNVNSAVTFSGSGDIEVRYLCRRYPNQTTNVNVVKNGSNTAAILDGYPTAGSYNTSTGRYSPGYSTGTTTINEGTLSIDDEINLGGNPGGWIDTTNTWHDGSFDADALLLNGGTIKATASFDIDDGNRGVTMGASGGTFEVDASRTLTIANPVAGTGDLTKTGDGVLALSSANTYAGDTRIGQGTLALHNADALQNTTVDLLGSDTGVLTFGTPAAYTLGGLKGSRDLDMGGKSLAIGNNGQTTAYSGRLSNGSLTKIGTGTLTLGGSNTYAGPTTVSDGVLSFSAADNLGPGDIILDGGTLRSTGSVGNILYVNNPITLADNGTLDTQHTNYTEYRGVISDGAGTFGFTKIGSKSLRLNANNTYDGETIITQGTTYVLANNALGSANGATTVASGVWFSLETNYTTPETLNLNGGILRTSAQSGTRTWWGDVVLGANDSSIQAKHQTSPGTLVVNGQISGPYRLLVGRYASGNVRFGAANTYSGDTRIVSGTLQLYNADALQNSTLDLLHSDAGVLTFGTPAAYTLGGLEGSRDLDMGGKSLAVGNNDESTTYSGQLSNGSLTKIGGGTLTLSGASTYAGNTVVADGTLALSHATSNNILPSSAAIDVQTDAVLDVTGLAGGGGLVLAAGQTLVGNGTVDGSVGVGLGATISAGASPGHLIITGDYTQDGTMLAELSGYMQGLEYDWIDVGGSATLGGVVDVDLLSFSPAIGSYYDILTAEGGITNGDLGGLTFDFSGADTGLYWWREIVSLGGDAEALRLTVSPEPATLVLLGFGAFGILARRRRSR